LKIGEKLLRLVTRFQESFAGFQLRGHAPARAAPHRYPTAGVAVDAAALAARAVAVGAGEPGIHGDFLHAATEQVPQVGIIIAIPLGFHSSGLL